MDQPGKCGRRVRVKAFHTRRGTSLKCRDDFLGCRPVVGEATRHQAVQHDPEPKQVGFRINGQTSNLFGCHEPDHPEDRAQSRDRFPLLVLTGEPKVEDLHPKREKGEGARIRRKSRSRIGTVERHPTTPFFSIQIFSSLMSR